MNKFFIYNIICKALDLLMDKNPDKDPRLAFVIVASFLLGFMYGIITMMVSVTEMLLK